MIIPISSRTEHKLASILLLLLQFEGMGNLIGPPMLLHQQVPVVHLEPVDTICFGDGVTEETTTARDGATNTTVTRKGRVVAIIKKDAYNNITSNFYGGLTFGITLSNGMTVDPNGITVMLTFDATIGTNGITPSNGMACHGPHGIQSAASSSGINKRGRQDGGFDDEEGTDDLAYYVVCGYDDEEDNEYANGGGAVYNKCNTSASRPAVTAAGTPVWKKLRSG